MTLPTNEVTCAFCAILAGRAPASVVHADARVVAFLDLRQAEPGHVLVVPRTHVPRVHLLGDEDAAALMQAAVRIAGALEAAFAPDGLSLWQSNGDAAFQEVDHVHLHVHPRRLRDGLLDIYPRGVPAPAAREGLEALAARVRAALART
jgi:histidine triad (HIT) family protein